MWLRKAAFRPIVGDRTRRIPLTGFLVRMGFVQKPDRVTEPGDYAIAVAS